MQQHERGSPYILRARMFVRLLAPPTLDTPSMYPGNPSCFVYPTPQSSLSLVQARTLVYRTHAAKKNPARDLHRYRWHRELWKLSVCCSPTAVQYIADAQVQTVTNLDSNTTGGKTKTRRQHQQHRQRQHTNTKNTYRRGRWQQTSSPAPSPSPLPSTPPKPSSRHRPQPKSPP